MDCNPLAHQLLESSNTTPSPNLTFPQWWWWYLFGPEEGVMCLVGHPKLKPCFFAPASGY